jgi:glycosyltransferase involved in cell wall biosynthesis
LKGVIRLIGSDAIPYFKGFVKNELIPEKNQNANATLLTYSFDKKSVMYTRLSMAIKVTEYMISGKPIFQFVPEDLAVTEYLKKNDAGFVATHPIKLSDSILKFIHDEKGRKRIVGNAVSLAKSSHLSESVASKLFDLISNL